MNKKILNLPLSKAYYFWNYSKLLRNRCAQAGALSIGKQLLVWDKDSKLAPSNGATAIILILSLKIQDRFIAIFSMKLFYVPIWVNKPIVKAGNISNFLADDTAVLGDEVELEVELGVEIVPGMVNVTSFEYS